MPSAVKMAPKMSKNQMRRMKKKEQKKAAQVSHTTILQLTSTN